jgi:hypothetical protein
LLQNFFRARIQTTDLKDHRDLRRNRSFDDKSVFEESLKV